MSTAALSVQPSSSPGAGPSVPLPSSSQDSQPKTFRRFRTSLEHTFRAAASGGKHKAKGPDLDMSSPGASAMPVARFLRHKHSKSDTSAMLAEKMEETTTRQSTRDKGKQRASFDLVQVQDREKSRLTGFGGLRKLESKVGLRKHTSRDASRTPEITEKDAGPSSSASVAKPRYRESGREQSTDAQKTKPKSAWSFLSPTLSQASASTPALDTISRSSSRPPATRVDRADEHGAKASPMNERVATRENDLDRRKDAGRERKVSISTPSPLRIPDRTRDRDRERQQESAQVRLRPTTPSPPNGTPQSSSKTRLTSPSSPSLASSSPSNSIQNSPVRHRPRPTPILSPAAGAFSTLSSASSSSSSHLPLQPPTPTTPVRNHGNSSSATLTRGSPSMPSTTMTSTNRATSPIPVKNRQSPVQSRPPLSPSASANANNRLRLRLAGTTSVTHLPMSPKMGSPASPTANAFNSTSSSGGASFSGSSSGSRGPERPERRRPSLSSTTSPTPVATSGRVTPTGSSNPSIPSHAAPTSSSRARANSTADRTREREHERGEVLQSTRSRASASATSLVLKNAAPSRTERSHSPTPRTRARRATSPLPVSVQSPASSPPEYRDTIRHASSLLIRELGGPRPRARSSSTSHSPFSSTADSSAIQGLAPEVWDECEQRLRLLARSERVWVPVGGPYNASSANLTSSSSVSINNIGGSAANSSVSGEERERRIFAEAVRDGYVLCQLVNKLRPGTIIRVDPNEDGFRSTVNVTKFLAAATGAFGVSQTELFQRDDLIKCTPDGLYRVARTVIALVMRVGEAASAAERATGKVLRGQSRGSQGPAHPNSPYATRSKTASVSTPDLSTLQRSISPPPRQENRWNPPSPSLSTVRSDILEEGNTGPPGASKKDNSYLNTRSPSGKTARTGAYTSSRSSGRIALTASNNESALDTGSEDSDEETFYDMVSASEHAPTPARLPKSPHRFRVDSINSSAAHVPTEPVRASVASGTTQTTNTTAQSSLLAIGRASIIDERASANFNTIRTATTVATSVAPSDLQSMYRPDSSSFTPRISEEPFWEESSTGNQHVNYAHSSNVLKMAPSMRDRRPSEAAVIDLSRVAEEAEEGSLNAHGDDSLELKKRPAAIQLGKGKWPDDFLSAFQAPPTRSISIKRPDTEKHLSSSPLSVSPPRKLVYVGESPPSNGNESLAQLAARRPTHRPRHSLDAPALLPKEVVYGREQSPGPDSGAPNPRVILRRNSSTNRHGIYIPRSNSASPSPSPDGVTRVPFPRSVSGEQSGVSVMEGSAVAAQQSRLSRGRFQSEVGDSTRRKPRPNSYDELGAKPNRSRIESMISLGGASSSNFSASDIRNSMDGSAVRKTLIIKEEGKSSTNFQLGNCIGRGQFGSVYRALNLNTGQMVAVKRIRLEGLSEDDIKQLMKEVDVVKSLSHPSIVKYEGMSRDSDTLNIVLEYAENGSLGQTLRAFGKLNEKLVATYVIKILEGLDYLHRNDVVHCDLKAANILTTKNGNVKLSDFGVSLNLRKVGRDHKSDVTGTPNWMAPEVIELKGASRASDIWSLGCTVIELLTGRPPYADIPNGMSVMYRIVDDPMPPIPDDWSPLLKDFLKQCFQRDPADRPSAEVLCEHDWLKQYSEIHKALRPKDSIPFLRRVSQDLAKQDMIRILGAMDAPVSDADALEQIQLSRGRPISPISLGFTGSPPNAKSIDPTSSKSPESESSISREHSFVRTAFGKPVLCRVCLQAVKRSAVVCEECALIAHSRCAPNAPPTCGLRTQLLQYANYSPQPDSPSALDILQHFTPSSSPVPDSALSSEPIPAREPEVSRAPTSFKVFGAFRRSRSSLSPEPTTPHTTSSGFQEGSTDSAPLRSGMSEAPNARRTGLLLRPNHARPRPLSMSSDNTTPNRSSLRSALSGSIDLSDDSRSHSHSHSHSQLSRSHSRGRMPSGISVTDGGSETEAETRYAPSRFSMAVSVADSTDPRRRGASIFAPSTVAGEDDDDEAILPGSLAQSGETHRRSSRRREPKATPDKDKGCVLQ